MGVCVWVYVYPFIMLLSSILNRFCTVTNTALKTKIMRIQEEAQFLLPYHSSFDRVLYQDYLMIAWNYSNLANKEKIKAYLNLSGREDKTLMRLMGDRVKSGFMDSLNTINTSSDLYERVYAWRVLLIVPQYMNKTASQTLNYSQIVRVCAGTIDPSIIYYANFIKHSINRRSLLMDFIQQVKAVADPRDGCYLLLLPFLYVYNCKEYFEFFETYSLQHIQHLNMYRFSYVLNDENLKRYSAAGFNRLKEYMFNVENWKKKSESEYRSCMKILVNLTKCKRQDAQVTTEINNFLQTEQEHLKEFNVSHSTRIQWLWKLYILLPHITSNRLNTLLVQIIQQPTIDKNFINSFLQTCFTLFATFSPQAHSHLLLHIQSTLLSKSESNYHSLLYLISFYSTTPSPFLQQLIEQYTLQEMQRNCTLQNDCVYIKSNFKSTLRLIQQLHKANLHNNIELPSLSVPHKHIAFTHVSDIICLLEILIMIGEGNQGLVQNEEKICEYLEDRHIKIEEICKIIEYLKVLQYEWSKEIYLKLIRSMFLKISQKKDQVILSEQELDYLDEEIVCRNKGTEGFDRFIRDCKKTPHLYSKHAKAYTNTELKIWR